VLAAFVRHYEKQMRSAERLARARRDCAFEAAFMLLDLNGNGYVDLVEFSTLLQRVSRPVFSLFDGETRRALDTAQTMHALQRLLEGDATLPVRGLGPAAFAECLLALRSETTTLTGAIARDGSESDDEDEDEPIGQSGGEDALPVQQGTVVVDGAHAHIGVNTSRRVDVAAELTGFDRHAHLLRCTFRSRSFKRVSDAAVVLSLVVLIAEIEMLDHSSWHSVYSIDAAAVAIDVAFLAEAFTKLWAFGCSRFSRRRQDVYALVVSLVVLVGDLAVLARGRANEQDADSSDSAAITALKIALGLRTLRLPRIIASLQQTSVIFRRLVKALPSFIGLAGLVWVLFNVFAQLGVALFGGHLRRDAWPLPSPSNPLYAYCNFNDFPSALVTLFALLVVNNWYEIMDGTVEAAGSHWWLRAYFYIWYLLASVGITNLVVAQMLENVSAALRDEDSRRMNLGSSDDLSERPGRGGFVMGGGGGRRHDNLTAEMAQLMRRGHVVGGEGSRRGSTYSTTRGESDGRRRVPRTAVGEVGIRQQSTVVAAAHQASPLCQWSTRAVACSR
jgi:hypothetical protein